MTRHTHIHLHPHDSFEESEHPRAANGQFGAAAKKLESLPSAYEESWGGDTVRLKDLGFDMTHAAIHGTGPIKPEWGKVGEAEIDKLIPSQPRVTKHGVRKYLADPDAAPFPWFT